MQDLNGLPDSAYVPAEDVEPASPDGSTQTSSRGSSSTSAPVAAGAVVAALLVFAVVGALLYYRRRRNQKASAKMAKLKPQVWLLPLAHGVQSGSCIHQSSWSTMYGALTPNSTLQHV